MKTPYDAALRVAERTLDQVRAAIGEATAMLQRIEEAERAARAAMLNESAIAGGDHLLAFDPYFTHARLQRENLAMAREAARRQLDTLRAEAVEHYGQTMAISSAVVDYRAAAILSEDRAEQSALDDVAASRIHLNRRRANG